VNLPGFTAEVSLGSVGYSKLSRATGGIGARSLDASPDRVEPALSEIARAVCNACRRNARNPEYDCALACLSFPQLITDRPSLFG
jgi:hypothetical protein